MKPLRCTPAAEAAGARWHHRWQTTVMTLFVRMAALLLLLPLLPVHAALHADQLAVVVNDADPISQEIGAYYQKARGLPAANLIHIRLPVGVDAVTGAEFEVQRAKVLAATPAHVQAYALAWTRPYRVDCMGITSAMTFGFDPAWCSGPNGCHMTRASPLFNYRTAAPFDDLGIRPSMLLAGTNFAEVRALIDRGIQSDGTEPHGSAWYAVTDDRQRNSREPAFLRAAKLPVRGLTPHLVRGPVKSDASDILFYFIGAVSVPGLESLRFLPGAAADHLTSFGGMLTDSSQMSALAWLKAGATGSYGTVQEPCNYPQKFPDPRVLVSYYTHGDTLIEAYWKSVSSPGEGVFVGEPLAHPWN